MVMSTVVMMLLLGTIDGSLLRIFYSHIFEAFTDRFCPNYYVLWPLEVGWSDIILARVAFTGL
jgi:hypothetical protein